MTAERLILLGRSGLAPGDDDSIVILTPAEFCIELPRFILSVETRKRRNWPEGIAVLSMSQSY